MLLRSLVIGFSLLFIPGISLAGSPLILNEGIQNLAPVVGVLFDDSGSVNDSNVRDADFFENTSKAVNLHNTNGSYWFKFSIKNTTGSAQERILSIGYAHVKKLVIYRVENDSLVEIDSTSAEQEYSKKAIPSRFPALRLSLPAVSETQYIARLQLGHIPLEYAVKLYPVGYFYKAEQESTVFFILFAGFLLALVAYNLSIYFSLGLPQFLYYSLIAISVILTNLGYEGYLYLLSDNLSVNLMSGILLQIGPIAGILIIQYMQYLADSNRYMPRLNRYANYLKVVLLAMFIFSFVFVDIQVVADPILLLILLVALVVSIRVYRVGNKAALYIAFGLMFLLLGAAGDYLVFTTQESVLDASTFGGGYLEWIRTYFYYISQAIAYFFLSMALAVYVRQVRDDRDIAKQASLNALEESNRLKGNYANQLESEIEKATAELREQAELLKQLDRQKSRFFTNISHEFRTPLTLIKGPVRGMAGGEYGQLNDKGKIATDICSRNIDRLSRLIDELLMLAEVESGASKLKVSIADINHFCRRTAALFTHTAVEKNIRFILNISSTVYPLYFDAPKLEKVLCNLLSNALKYTPEDGEVILSVEANKREEKSTGSFIDIKVEDTGPGINENEQVQVFDRFFRASHTDESAIEGSGIGLSLVKDLVALHGGDVSVRARTDAQGKTGSCFTVNLPLGKAHLHEDEIQVQHSIINTENPVSLNSNNQHGRDQLNKAHDKTLLVVEDNSDMRTFVVSLLDQDYQIIEAVHGKQALETLAEHHVDLVISDIMMPEMDGIRLLESIRSEEKWQWIPVVLLTAKAADEDRIQALRARADEYLAKPFNEEELRLKVANLLRRISTQAPAVNHSEEVQPKVLTTEEQASNFLKKARDRVLSNLAGSDFDVQALADAMHMSRSTLQRRIESEAAVTAAQFIRHIRLVQAHQFIVNKSHRTMAETAYAVGFSHPGYFSKLYKKYTAQLAQQ